MSKELPITRDGYDEFVQWLEESFPQLSSRQKLMVLNLYMNWGIVLVAAKKAGIDRKTHYNWLNAYPDYKEACDSVIPLGRDFILDLAESKLISRINEGDSGLIKFTLETIGKERGYVRRIEQTGMNGKDLPAGSIPIPIPGATTPDEAAQAYIAFINAGKTE